MTGKSVSELYREYYDEMVRERQIVDNLFIPWEPDARPFPAQQAFLQDTSLTKLARCGNRAAKTFTTNHSLSLKLRRIHPYNSRWNEDYRKSKPKIFWMAGPNFDFLTEVCWKQYLVKMIPRWYYTDDNLNEMITIEKDKEKEYYTKIRFRNGDVLEFKTYKQAYLAIMGRAIDHLTVDEMPPNLSQLVELITRCCDKDGEVELGFTPLVENEDIRNWVDNHSTLAIHQWSVMDNPVYGNNPDKLARLLAEWEHLPEPERKARRDGDWYYEMDGTEQVFQNVTPEIVEDFPVPYWWRQVRVADPAARRTGFAILAEDPNDGVWYCIEAREFEWKGALAKADQIEEQMDRLAIPGTKYLYSIYDNREAWFGSHTSGKWRPCILKNKELQIMALREMMQDKKLRFFKNKAALAVKQIYTYRRREDGNIIKKKDHVVDCLQYFSREVPAPLTKEQQKRMLSREDWQAELYQAYKEEQKKNEKKTNYASKYGIRHSNITIRSARLRRRTRR